MSKSPAGRPDLEGVSVLVVEDDQDCRALVERMLRDRRAEVTAVASGHEALTLLQNRRADAVLRSRRADVLVSDLGLPGLDGYGFLEEVRRLEEARGFVSMPAHALTAFTDTVHL